MGMGFNEYFEADKVQQKLELLIKKYPIEQHARKWLTCCRTIKTYITLIEKEAKKSEDNLRKGEAS